MPRECRCWKASRGGGARLWKSRSVETQRHGFHCAWKSRKGRGIPTFPQPRRRVLYLELESGHITCYKNRTSSRANNNPRSSATVVAQSVRVGARLIRILCSVTVRSVPKKVARTQLLV